MKTAFLCAGEAATRLGMGVDFVPAAPAAADVFELAADATGLEVFSLCAQGPAEELARPQNANPCIVACALACAAALRARGVTAQAVGGYGAGEYAALALAGAVDDERALQLAARRGAMLALAAARGADGMSTAKRNMELALKGTLLTQPQLELYSAGSGGRFDVAQANTLLLQQMDARPLLDELIAAMLADGVERFVVCGPDAGLAARAERVVDAAGSNAHVALVGGAADVEQFA